MIMACAELWYKLLKDTEIVESNGKFYIKQSPNELYDTKEEALRVQKLIRDIATI